MDANQWVELIEEEPWSLGDLSEKHCDELLAVLRFAAAAGEMAGRLAEALSYLVWASKAGAPVPAHLLEVASMTLTEAAGVACREPRAEPRRLNS